MTLRCRSHTWSLSLSTAFHAASVVPYSGPGGERELLAGGTRCNGAVRGSCNGVGGWEISCNWTGGGSRNGEERGHVFMVSVAMSIVRMM